VAEKKRRRVFRSKRTEVSLDEFGGRADGGLAIVGADGKMLHMTPARVASAMRYLVARVQLNDPYGLPERVALTSAVLGEGVTYLTRSLAAVLSYDTNSTVAVVDLNWRRPTEKDDEKAGGGIAAVATAQTPLEDVLITTSNPRLALVPAGEVPIARRPALSSSVELGAALDQVSERFDHVILDLPPVLMSSDALQLSELSDAFVMVVRQGATPQSQVESALEELVGIQCLGVVLNRFDSKIPRRIRRLVGV
jgi:Mrp family chromosome partitioning ATPase